MKEKEWRPVGGLMDPEVESISGMLNDTMIEPVIRDNLLEKDPRIDGKLKKRSINYKEI